VKSSLFGVWQNRNFDGNTIERGLFSEMQGLFRNYLERASLGFPQCWCDLPTGLTRGGPLARTPSSWSTDFMSGPTIARRCRSV